MLNILSKFLGGGKSGGGADRVAAFIGAMEKDLHLDTQQKTAVEQALRQFMQDRKSAKQSGKQRCYERRKRSIQRSDLCYFAG